MHCCEDELLRTGFIVHGKLHVSAKACHKIVLEIVIIREQRLSTTESQWHFMECGTLNYCVLGYWQVGRISDLFLRKLNCLLDRVDEKKFKDCPPESSTFSMHRYVQHLLDIISFTDF